MSDPAWPRWAALQLVRVIGAVLVLAGLLAANDRIPLGHVAGAIMAVFGLLTFALVPKLLARRWRSRK
jgi:hypothetical protein